MASLRRIPPVVWILLPALLGVLYAAAFEWLAPDPVPSELPPAQAMVTWRFKDLDAYERSFPGPRPQGAPSPRDRMAQARNLPQLRGVAHHRPVLEVWLPLAPLTDETLTILPVEDADALKAHFNDVGRIDEGFLRHAQHLAVRGDWAAIGAHRDSVRRLGEGGLCPPSRGEDMAVSADLAGLAAFALQRVEQAPWRSILARMGVEVERAELKRDPATGMTTLEVPRALAVARVVDGWRRAHLWSWTQERRVEIELEPQPSSPLPALLEQAHQAGATPLSWPSPPARSPLMVLLTSGAARRVWVSTLFHLGVRLTQAQATDEALAELESSLAAPKPQGPLLLYAERAEGTGSALNLALVAESGQLPDLGALLAPLAQGASRDLAEGDAPLLLGVAEPGNKLSPAGRVLRAAISTPEREWDVLALGASPEALLEGWRQEVLMPTPLEIGREPGWTTLAVLRIAQDRAPGLLGAALEPGGLLHALADGPLSAEVLTDGRVLRIRLRAGDAPAR